MKKFEIVNKLTRTAHAAGFQLKKHSPEILAIGGVIGIGVTIFAACKATLKVNEVVDTAKENVEKIHKSVENGVTEAGLEYSPEDGKKDLSLVYLQTGLELVKLYGPAVIMGTLSVTAMLSSNHILRKRNVALAAAYTAERTMFKEYRGRVVERFGEALDKELRYNVKSKEVEEIVVNEDGTETVVKKNVDVINLSPNSYSDYARFFDDGCTGWDPDPAFSLMFLNRQQDYANEKLQSRGYLFLNEVYEMLGIPVCPMGQEVGWIYDKENPVGDNYVDFGIFDGHREKSRDFVNGYEKVILLDFNPDGCILHRI